MYTYSTHIPPGHKQHGLGDDHRGHSQSEAVSTGDDVVQLEGLEVQVDFRIRLEKLVEIILS